MLGVVRWDVSPEMFEIAGREARWYGLLFALGLLFFGPWIVERMWKHERAKEEWYNQIFLYVVLGAVIGARLGHCLFYAPSYYLANPIEILYVWEGGLASHGGTLGIILGLIFFASKKGNPSLLWALDRIAVPTGLVAALIRLGNLMNSEIFGAPTSASWGFSFVRSGEYYRLIEKMKTGLPLSEVEAQLINGTMGWHPTQIYEAVAYLITFAVCMWLYWRRDVARRYEGMLIGVFFIMLFGARILIEHIKNVQEPWELDMIATYGINMGQLLSVPFVLIGIWLVVRAKKQVNQ